MTARDQMVGPWQVPVADVRGDADGLQHLSSAKPMAMGERTPMAAVDAPASGRMAVGEAITNIAAARDRGDRRHQALRQLDGRRRPSGEDAALFDTVQAVGMELCPRSASSIPVGKDSMSMRTAWRKTARRRTGGHRAAVADRHRLRAGARRAQDPDAATAHRRGRHRAAADRPGRGQEPPRRLGAGAGVQAGRRCAPDVDEPGEAQGILRADPAARTRDGKLLAYHDRSDGGLFAAVCEMAFAGSRRAVTSTARYDASADVDGIERG